MPSKIQLDENLWFLFICLQKSDYKTIDFNAVGQATNLKSPAARMRYTRLKRQIEGGTLIGTHGTPFLGAAEKMSSEIGKRSRDSQSEYDANEYPALFPKRPSTDRKIKPESENFSDQCGPEYTESDCSEDEMPLAKRRNDKLRLDHVLSESSSVTTAQSGILCGLYMEHDRHNLEPKLQRNACYMQSEFPQDLLYVCNPSSRDNQPYVSSNRCLDVSTQSVDENENSRHI